MAVPSCKYVLFMVQELPWSLVCSGSQIHQNINVVLNFWTNYHLSLTQSQDQNYSNMILNEMLLKKLLTKHYRNIACQQFRQTLNETDCNFLGQIFQAQTKALLTYAPLG